MRHASVAGDDTAFLNNISSSVHVAVFSYVQYEPLQEPTQPPTTLLSPTQLLEWHTGDAFDIAHLLCSCLIGAGYDAYVCYGTAPKRICLKDQSRLPCPMLDKIASTADGKTAEDDSTADEQVRSSARVAMPRQHARTHSTVDSARACARRRQTVAVTAMSTTSRARAYTWRTRASGSARKPRTISRSGSKTRRTTKKRRRRRRMTHSTTSDCTLGCSSAAASGRCRKTCSWSRPPDVHSGSQGALSPTSHSTCLFYPGSSILHAPLQLLPVHQLARCVQRCELLDQRRCGHPDPPARRAFPQRLDGDVRGACVRVEIVRVSHNDVC